MQKSRNLNAVNISPRIRSGSKKQFGGKWKKVSGQFKDLANGNKGKHDWRWSGTWEGKSAARNKININILQQTFQFQWKWLSMLSLHCIQFPAFFCLSCCGLLRRFRVNNPYEMNFKKHPRNHPSNKLSQLYWRCTICVLSLRFLRKRNFDVRIFMHVHNKSTNRDKWHAQKSLLYILWPLFKRTEKLLHSIRKNQHGKLKKARKELLASVLLLLFAICIVKCCHNISNMFVLCWRKKSFRPLRPPVAWRRCSCVGVA